MVLIEGASFGGDAAFGPFPRFGHHHQEGMANVATAAHQQFQPVIEFAAVTALAPEHRTQQRFVALPKRMGEIAFAGVHPILVALNGVNFAIVTEQTEGLRQLPGRCGVGAIALVKDGNRRLKIFITQVRIEVGQLLSQHQAFVDNGAIAQTGDVETLYAPLLGGFLGAIDNRFAHQIE